MCSLMIKDPYFEQCKKSKSTQARCKTRSKKRMDDVARFAKFGDFITAEHKILKVDNWSRCRHRKALIAQDREIDSKLSD